MIEGYLENSRNLRHVLQLVDVRHEPTSDDQMMVEYLRHYEIPFTVVATKCDKISKAARGRSHSRDLPEAGGAALGNHPLFLRRRHRPGQAALLPGTDRPGKAH